MEGPDPAPNPAGATPTAESRPTNLPQPHSSVLVFPKTPSRNLQRLVAKATTKESADALNNTHEDETVD
jgi:hypothetical protein